MSAERTYSVMTTGTVQDGFDENYVAQAFVELLHTTPEKASAFVTSAQCIASNLSKEKAEAYEAS